MQDESRGAVRHLRQWATSKDVAPSDIERVLVGLETLERPDHGEASADSPDPACPVPGLTARPWWNPEIFPWTAGLLAEADAIRAEYFEVSSRLTRSEALRNRDDIGRLRASGRWTTVQLYHRGLRQAQAESFPVAVASLLRITEPPCGMAFYSTLEPGSRIEPHRGFTNAHLRAHLVIRANDDARFRVADEWRAWQDHQLLVFDDTFEHEAMNDGDDDRVVLLFDIWHPDLTEVERMAFQESMDFLRKQRARHHLLNALATG
ncbi:aspartyl/asparaginyl beta-hydroxylase domain-containing protein [Actinoplanes sp. NPDC049668]|uniref:aspartyl/asparaginyl beta-hydroxylase domain-containing protein n=1 Tax=unclassified Actinoplanes TaxID=2626549 RepID=UPI0033BF217D